MFSISIAVLNFFVGCCVAYAAYWRGWRTGNTESYSEFEDKLDEYAEFSRKANQKASEEIQKEFVVILHEATEDTFVDGFRQGFANGQKMPDVVVEVALQGLDEAVRLRGECARKGLFLVKDESEGEVC